MGFGVLFIVAGRDSYIQTCFSWWASYAFPSAKNPIVVKPAVPVAEQVKVMGENGAPVIIEWQASFLVQNGETIECSRDRSWTRDLLKYRPMAIDHILVYQAQKLMTGANVHGLKLLIFCYETSNSSSERRTQLEQLLREFVASQNRIVAAQMRAEQARKYSQDVCVASDALNRRIERELP